MSDEETSLPQWGAHPSNKEWSGFGKGATVKVTPKQALANAEALLAESKEHGRYPKVGVRDEEGRRFREKFGVRSTIRKPEADQEMECVARHNARLARKGKTGPLSGIRSYDQLSALRSFVHDVMRSIRGDWDRERAAPYRMSELRRIQWRVPVLQRGQINTLYERGYSGSLTRDASTEADFKQVDKIIEGATGPYVWPRSRAQYDALLRLIRKQDASETPLKEDDDSGLSGLEGMWLGEVAPLRSAGIDNSAKLVAAALEYRKLCDEPPIERDEMDEIRRYGSILLVGRHLQTNKPLSPKQRRAYEDRLQTLLDGYTERELAGLRGSGVPPRRTRREITQSVKPTPVGILPAKWHPSWDTPVPKLTDYPSVEYLEQVGRDNWRLLLEGSQSGRLLEPERLQETKKAYAKRHREKRPTKLWDWWTSSQSLARDASQILRAAAWSAREEQLGTAPTFSRSKFRTAANKVIQLSEPFQLRPGVEARYYIAPERYDDSTKTAYFGLGVLFRSGDDEWSLGTGYRLPYDAMQAHGASAVAHRDQMARMFGAPARRQRNTSRLKHSLLR